MCLQHGVPLKLLCEKFAHTRFEPSGWTGNEQIGYAKSVMDYLFRWMQLRFLSGQQLDLFAGLTPASGPAQPALTASSVILSEPHSANSDAVILSEGRSPESKNPEAASPTHTAATFSATSPSGPWALDPGPSSSDPWSAAATAPLYTDRTPPQQGIASEPQAVISKDLQARSGTSPSGSSTLDPGPLAAVEDRGIYHTASAMASMVNMGDSPSCSTCGSIMTRNGSCYRCMECGSTSGCS
jgi:ribonucleoside-diphosphate reductase alpha chain